MRKSQRSLSAGARRCRWRRRRQRRTVRPRRGGSVPALSTGARCRRYPRARFTLSASSTASSARTPVEPGTWCVGVEGEGRLPQLLLVVALAVGLLAYQRAQVSSSKVGQSPSRRAPPRSCSILHPKRRRRCPRAGEHWRSAVVWPRQCPAWTSPASSRARRPLQAHLLHFEATRHCLVVEVFLDRSNARWLSHLAAVAQFSRQLRALGLASSHHITKVVWSAGSSQTSPRAHAALDLGRAVATLARRRARS